jgi:hypothetical protein
MRFDEDPPLYSEILPNLWQGGTDDDQTIYRGQKRLPTMNDPKPFDVVVTLDSYSLPVGWLVKELRYGFADGPVDAEVLEELERISDWTYIEWQAGNRVLIRCQAGLNRSSLVTGLVLLKSGKKFEEVIALIRSQRGEYALSNNHFYEHLQKWRKNK